MTEPADNDLAARLSEALREQQDEERQVARRGLERQADTDEKLAAALAQQHDELDGV